MQALKKIFFSTLILLCALSATAQGGATIEKFSQLTRPLKCWVFRHPFAARRAFRITEDVLNITDSISRVKTLDGDKNGGQVDAFRHSYWMAILSQNIGWRKAIGLGKAHEKSNYLDYKKHKLEDGAHPDKISCDMDLFNNAVGAAIGKDNQQAKGVDLQILIIDAIRAGEMKIIKKDSLGNFLDDTGKIIPMDSIQGKWENRKCLVKSN